MMELGLQNRKDFLGKVISNCRNVLVTLRKTDVYELETPLGQDRHPMPGREGSG